MPMSWLLPPPEHPDKHKERPNITHTYLWNNSPYHIHHRAFTPSIKRTLEKARLYDRLSGEKRNFTEGSISAGFAVCKSESLVIPDQDELNFVRNLYGIFKWSPFQEG